MKSILIGAVIAIAAYGIAMAQGSHHVSGYYRSDGTYVEPHYQTDPNSTRADNWSNEGNSNPYTGQSGTEPNNYSTYGAETPRYDAPATSYPNQSSSYGVPAPIGGRSPSQASSY